MCALGVKYDFLVMKMVIFILKKYLKFIVDVLEIAADEEFLDERSLYLIIPSGMERLIIMRLPTSFRMIVHRQFRFLQAWQRKILRNIMIQHIIMRGHPVPLWDFPVMAQVFIL